jgi:hypothetical protein
VIWAVPVNVAATFRGAPDTRSGRVVVDVVDVVVAGRVVEVVVDVDDVVAGRVVVVVVVVVVVDVDVDDDDELLDEDPDWAEADPPELLSALTTMAIPHAPASSGREKCNRFMHSAWTARVLRAWARCEEMVKNQGHDVAFH